MSYGAIELFSITEAARKLGISRARAQSLVAGNLLHPFAFLGKTQLLFSQDEINRSRGEIQQLGRLMKKAARSRDRR